MRTPLTLFAALLAAHVAAAPSTWLEVKSGHFTVITNAGEKEGRRTAWQFEQIRGALVKLWPWAKIDTGRSFVVFAAKDETTLKTLGPQYWEGKQFRPVSFGAEGRDRHFIALRTDTREPDEYGANPYQSAYWSYTASVFTRSFPRRLPAWYSRGIAEVMSNTIVRDKEIHVGRPIRERLDRIRERASIPLGEFLAADRGSPWLTHLDDVWLFHAQAWALVHYLMFGEKGANMGKVNLFNRMLHDGKEPDVALREAFGDMKPYLEGMRAYVQRDLFGYVRVPVSLETRPEAYATRTLSAGEAAVLRAEMLVAMNRPIEARALAAEAAQADPSLAGPWEIEAELLDAEGRREEAKAAFAKAAQAESKKGRVFYRLAQLEWAPGSDKAKLERLATNLEKARQLDPQSAHTLSFLADVRAELEQDDEAFALAKKAVEIEPAESYHRLTLARVLWSLRRTDEAIQMAQSALRAADNDSERARAQEFLGFAARAPRPGPAPSAAETSDVPASGAAATSAAPIVSGVRIPESARAVGPVAECLQSRNDRACAEAAPQLAAACESGKSDACRSIGSLYDGGFGVPQDKGRAGVMYDRACRGGDKAGCARLAVLQAQGQGVARDTAGAMSTLQRLCKDGVDDGCIGWALILASTPGSAGMAKARELLEATCDRKNDEACRLLKSMPR